MSKSIPDVKFELHSVYKTYADQLFLSGKVSDLLLDNSDIPAAGGQVEGSVRALLNQLLPGRVNVSHGHIVDSSAKISYQQDIIIAESYYSRSLIKTLDGTEFYPFEAVFATGEVKKTWSISKMNSAMSSIKHNKEGLTRYPVPPNFLETGSKFVDVSSPLTKNGFRNPLFGFTFSLENDKSYKPQDFSNLYSEYNNWKYLPNISLVLKEGIYVLVDVEKIERGELSIKLYPEFVDKYEKCKWIFLQLKPAESLAYLVFMLTQHINDSVLSKASTMDYGSAMLNIDKTSIYPM